MFAVWCVPVDQNPMKSDLTTSVIGMLLTQKKKKRQENAECYVEITYNLLILSVCFMAIMDFMKTLSLSILSL